MSPATEFGDPRRPPSGVLGYLLLVAALAGGLGMAVGGGVDLAGEGGTSSATGEGSELSQALGEAVRLRHEGNFRGAWQVLCEAREKQPGQPALALELAQLHFQWAERGRSRLDMEERVRLEFAWEYLLSALGTRRDWPRARMMAAQVALARARTLGRSASQQAEDPPRVLSLVEEAEGWIRQARSEVPREPSLEVPERALSELESGLANEAALLAYKQARALVRRALPGDLEVARTRLTGLAEAPGTPPHVAKEARRELDLLAAPASWRTWGTDG